VALAAPRLRVRLPGGSGGRAGRQAWAAGIVETPSALSPYLEHPWVVANDRLRAAGWAPEHTNEEAFVSVEPSSWQTMSVRRRQQLALGAAAGALGAVAGGAVALARRRSRRAS
jgi:hypothetical protein